MTTAPSFFLNNAVRSNAVRSNAVRSNAVRSNAVRGAAIALFALAIAPLAACGENDDNRQTFECEYDETSLAWSDKAPAHDTFDALMEDVGGTFDDAVIDDKAGIVVIEKGAGVPTLFTNTAGGCPDYTELPIVLTLTQDAATSAHRLNAEWSDLDERHVGLKVQALVSDRASLVALKPLPTLDEKQSDLGVHLDMNISKGTGQFTISVETADAGGNDGSISEHRERWIHFSFGDRAF